MGTLGTKHPDAQRTEEQARKLEERFTRLLAQRSRGLSAEFEPIEGFSVIHRRAPTSTERYPAQISPRRHGVNVPTNVSDVEIEIDRRSKRTIFQPGDFTVVPCGAGSNGNVFRTSEFVHLMMEDECVQKIAEEIDRPGRVELLPILQGRDELLRHLAHTLVGELSKGPEADSLYSEILSRAVVAHTVRNMGVSATRDEGEYRLSNSALGTVVDYVASNLDGDIRIKDLAAVAGVSPSRLHRQFKLAMGVPLHRYVVAQRVKRARELLAGSKLSFAEIAYRTGFADQSHLTRVMRQHTGLTPKAFRSI
jgi:AraC family transcriptional regulator